MGMKEDRKEREEEREEGEEWNGKEGGMMGKGRTKEWDGKEGWEKKE